MRHERWESGRRYHAGRHLAALLGDIPQVALLNTREPTHVGGGVLDLSFVSRFFDIDATITWPAITSSLWSTFLCHHPYRHLDRLGRAFTVRNWESSELPSHVTWVPLSVRTTWRKRKRTSSTPSIKRLIRHSPALHLQQNCIKICAEMKEANHRLNMARNLAPRNNSKATRCLPRAAIRRAKATPTGSRRSTGWRVVHP